MARIRSWAEKQQFPALKGIVEFKRTRGQVVVATWPRKRGKRSTPMQRLWRAWFKEANRLAKIGDPTELRLAIERTRGSGLYPRDLLLRMMSHGMVDIIDEDGTPITRKIWRLENVTWQGFILQLTANQTSGVGVNFAPTWPVPVLQTMPFWNAGAPDRVTIPTGIEIMSFEAIYREVGGGNADDAITIQRVSPALNIATIFARTPATGGLYSSSGPVLVTPGEEYLVRYLLNSSGVLAAGGPTWFKGTILQATVP